MKTFVRVTLVAAFALFVWYLFADRLTPFTANARVKAIVVPIVPQVSGYISAVGYSNTRYSEAGEVLAQIDQRPFQLKVDEAKAQLELASQDVGASSAEVEIAQADVARAKTDLENMRLQTERVFELEKKGLVAVARGDDARSKLAGSEAALAAAEADLLRARERLGSEGRDNPQLRAAVAALGEAQLQLEWSTLKAPSYGFVVDVAIDEGSYVKAGQPAMTFVSADDIWIEAYMTENNIGRMKIGNPTEVVLDIHPGRVLEGVVASFSGAASSGSDAKAGQLQSPPRTSGWMRDPQRFPVRIRLPGYERGDATDDVVLQMNGQADVIVYTGDNFVLNAIGALYIRLMSVLSYAY